MEPLDEVVPPVLSLPTRSRMYHEILKKTQRRYEHAAASVEKSERYMKSTQKEIQRRLRLLRTRTTTHIQLPVME
eukprot:scaffold1526_cov124-Pinguiococcus_pyrenoidosus.AAC.1